MYLININRYLYKFSLVLTIEIDYMLHVDCNTNPMGQLIPTQNLKIE